MLDSSSLDTLSSTKSVNMDSPWESFTKWIWLPGYDDSRNPGSIVLFRREFDLLDTSPMSINVTADSRYRLYLNGHLISFGPCKGTPLHWHYETVDATPHLQPGTNVIAAQVLRYSPAHRGNTSIMRTGTPGFMLLARSEGVRSPLTLGITLPLTCLVSSGHR